MPLKTNTFITLLCCFIAIASLPPKNIYLMENESALFWPHRESPSPNISHYIVFDGTSYEEYFALKQELSIQTDFTSIVDIFIANADAAQETVYICRITKLGVLSVDQITVESKIAEYFRMQVGHTMTEGVLLSGNAVVLWNKTHYSLCYYNMYDKKTAKTVSNFTGYPLDRICKKGSGMMVLCRDKNQVTFIVLDQQKLVEIVYETSLDDPVSFIQCLNANCSLLAIGSQRQVSITQILEQQLKTVSVITVSYGQSVITQGAYDISSEQLLVALQGYMLIYSAAPYLKQNLQYNITLGWGQAQELILVGGNIYMKCKDGTAIVYLYDASIDFYVPMNSSQCMTRLGSALLYELCDHNFTIRALNFHSLRVLPQKLERQLLIKVVTNEEIYFMTLKVFPTQEGQIYINKLLPVMQMRYSDEEFVSLQNCFTGSEIVALRISAFGSLEQSTLQIHSIARYYSLYVLEKCAQVVFKSEDSFFRLLPIFPFQFEERYYIEECTKGLINFWCKLVSIRKQEIASNLTVVMTPNGLGFFYYLRHRLLFETNLTTICVDEQLFPNHTITRFTMIGGWGVEISLNSEETYIVYLNYLLGPPRRPILNVDMVLKQPLVKYFYQRDCLVSVDISTQTLTVATQSKSKTYRWGGLSPKLSEYPYLLVFEDYLLALNLTHLSKLSLLNTSMVLYQYLFNPSQMPFAQIQLIANFLIIQYSPMQFEVYNLREQSFALLMYRNKGKTLLEGMINSQGTLLLSLKDEGYFVQIVSRPFLSLGPLAPNRTTLFQTYKIQITPIKQVSDSQIYPVSQQLQLSVAYHSNQISIFCKKPKSIILPSSCVDCVQLIGESQFAGPVFEYDYLSDPFNGEFTMRQHMHERGSCISNQWSEHRVVRDWRGVNSSHIVMSSAASVVVDGKIIGTDGGFCWKYIPTEFGFVLVCQDVFILLDQSSVAHFSAHREQLDESKADSFSLSYDGRIYISTLQRPNELAIYIIQIPTVKLLMVKSVPQNIRSFAHSLSRLVLLSDTCLCVYGDVELAPVCSPLSLIIQSRYAASYHFEQIIPIGTSGKLLILSKNALNAHIEFEVAVIGNNSLDITVLNAYAGYEGFQFSRLIGLFGSNNIYDSFLVEYSTRNEVYLAYYPYNAGFNSRGTLGFFKNANLQLKSTQYLVFQLSLQARSNQNCTRYEIQRDLALLINYEVAPVINYMIIKSENSASSTTLHLKVLYQSNTTPWYYFALVIFSLSLAFLAFALLIRRLASNAEEDCYCNLKGDEEPSSLMHSNESSPEAYVGNKSAG